MATCDHGNHSKVSGTGVETRCSNDETEDSQAQRPHDMEGRVLASVGRVVVKNGHKHSNNIRWNSKEKRFDLVITKGTNHSGKEVGCSTGHLDAKENESKEVEAGVLKSEFEPSAPVRFVFINLASICDESPFCNTALGWGEPLSG